MDIKTKPMNREYKFRAWITDNEDDDFYMTYDLAFEQYLPINTLLNNVAHLMQYTGLKDKNDKEIYEGDIVHVLFADSREMMGRDADYKDEVYYEQQTASFMIKREPYGADSLEDDLGKSIEVIGNIYEHPNLLKQ